MWFRISKTIYKELGQAIAVMFHQVENANPDPGIIRKSYIETLSMKNPVTEMTVLPEWFNDSFDQTN